MGLATGDIGDMLLTGEAGAALSTAVASIGHAAGSVGRVTVDQLQWLVGRVLSVGNQGTGQLTIQAGGDVVNLDAAIGDRFGSTGAATVTGAGSTWICGDELFVGEFGAGAPTITDGGSVDDVVAIIGRNSGSSGTVTVAGVGSTWTHSEDLVVGVDGMGTLAITGGEVVVGGSLRANVQSRVQLDGGQLTVNVFGEGSLNALEWAKRHTPPHSLQRPDDRPRRALRLDDAAG